SALAERGLETCPRGHLNPRTRPSCYPPRSRMKILAISGSLRATSSNTHVLLALARLAPDDVEVSLCRSVADLPHFNPDVEGAADLPAAVLALRADLAAADALAISCPEYAHGIPGSFKNALDWL